MRFTLLIIVVFTTHISGVFNTTSIELFSASDPNSADSFGTVKPEKAKVYIIRPSHGAPIIRMRLERDGIPMGSTKPSNMFIVLSLQAPMYSPPSPRIAKT